jgi:hypothetical protein
MADLSEKRLLPSIFYVKFMLGRRSRERVNAMSDLNNDDLPSGNPSLKTVLIVVCSLVLVAMVITFHTALGL